MSAGLVALELDRIEGVAKKFTQDGIVHPKLFRILNRKFQGDYAKVFEMLSESAVKKYVFKPSGRIVWIVKGRERDYLIYPEAPYCHCTNFYIHVINGQAKVCTHLVAQRLAYALNIHETITESDEIFEGLMKEWKSVENV